MVTEYEGYSRDWPKCPTCGTDLEKFREYDDMIPIWICNTCRKTLKVDSVTYYKVRGE